MQAATMIGRGSNVVAIAAAISAAFQDSNPHRASSHPRNAGPRVQQQRGGGPRFGGGGGRGGNGRFQVR